MKFAYQSQGGPLLSWKSGYPPMQARAADAKSLGAYESTVPNHPLPGAPEMISGIADSLNSVQSVAGMAVAGYHGWKRTGSIGWTAVWALAGNVAPLIAIGVAVVQGFAKHKHEYKAEAGVHTGWKVKKQRRTRKMGGRMGDWKDT